LVLPEQNSPFFCFLIEALAFNSSFRLYLAAMLVGSRFTRSTNINASKTHFVRLY